MKNTIYKLAGILLLLFSANLPSKATELLMQNFQINVGETTEVTVNVNNGAAGMFDYLGFQFDLYLPDGLFLQQASLNQGLAGFSLQTKDYGNGVYRIICFSERATPSNSLALVSLTLKASELANPRNATILIKNAIFSSTNGQDINVESSESTVEIIQTVSGELTIPSFDINRNESTTVSVSAQVNTDNMVPYRGFQFDLALPETLTVESALINQSLTDFTLQYKNRGDGIYRFIAYSPSQPSSITEDLVSITFKATNNAVKGTEPINISNVTFSATNGSDIQFENSSSQVSFSVPVTDLILNAENLVLIESQNFQLIASIVPEDADIQEISWASNNPDYVTVSRSGLITALSAGTATVTATCGEAQASCTVTVKGSGDIDVTPGGDTPGSKDEDQGNGWIQGNDVYVHVNRTVNLDLSIPDDLTEMPTLEWNLDDGGQQYVKLVPSDDTLSAAFTGVKFGETRYNVSLNGQQLLSGKVTVIAEVTMNSLLLEPASLSMAQNALPVELKTKYTPQDATMPEFNWTSSVPTVASVDQNGKVTPVGQGQAVITATALDGSGLSALCQVTVTAPVAESFEFVFDETVIGGKDGISLYIGDSYRFEPKAQDGYVLPAISWSTSDANTVSVNDDGTVNALSLGEATITASATVNNQEVKAECKVTVIPVPLESVIVTAQTTTSLMDGETVQLTAKTEPLNATAPIEIKWSSDKPEIATVNETTGLVTAHATLGKAVITATASNPADKQVSGSIEVTVIATGASRVILSAYDLTMMVGQENRLTGTVEPATTTNPTINWTIDNPLIASIDNDGNVAALSAGTATVTATCGEAQASCTVTVKGSGDIDVTPGGDTPGSKDEDEGNGWIQGNDVYVHVNRTVNLDLSIPDDLTEMPTLEWNLDDGGQQYVTLVPSDDTLSAAFTGVKFGETRYTVSLNGQQLLSGKVTVIAEVTMNSLLLEPASLSMAQNALPVELKTKYTPQDATMPEFNWTSSETSVASVDPNGKVTPVGQGQTEITATALDGSGLSAVCQVMVTEPIDDNFELWFDDAVMGGVNGVTIYLGEEFTLTPKARPGYVLPKDISWSSSDQSKVSVDQNGNVKGEAIGEAFITATAVVNEKSASSSCKVTVNPILATSISIEGNDIHTLKQTETLELSAIVNPENTTYQEVIWKSSDESKATVSNSGLVTAIEEGDVEITASLSYQPQITASYNLTIQKRLLGDANDNGIVNVADVGTISDYIVQKPVYQFCFVNADVITDGKITTADVTATVDIIFNDTPSMAKFATARKISAVGNNELIVDNFNSYASSIVDVNLKNPSEFTGLQGSIIIPEGVTIKNVTKGAGARDHILNFNVTDRGTVEFILYSLQNASFKEMGALIELEIQADRESNDMIVENILASDKAANEYSLSFTGGKNKDIETSLDSIENTRIKIYSSSEGIVILNAQGENVNIFNIAGERIISTDAGSNREFYSLTKGIYIVTVKTETAKLIVK